MLLQCAQHHCLKGEQAVTSDRTEKLQNRLIHGQAHGFRAVLTGRTGGCLEAWVPFEGMTMLEAQ